MTAWCTLEKPQGKPGSSNFTSVHTEPQTRKEAWGPQEPSDNVKDFVKMKRGSNHNQREPLSPPAAVERCTRCTKDQMWLAYDVFRSMDVQKRQRISRTDFFAKVQNFKTVDELKIIRKSCLGDRFRESDKAVDLTEFLRLLWPGATEEDVAKMLRWAQLRDAQAVLQRGNFRGDLHELQQIFDHLDDDGDGLLTVIELCRAHILTGKEIQALMKGKDNINFQEFCDYVQSHLKNVYVSASTKKIIDEEELQAGLKKQSKKSKFSY